MKKIDLGQTIGILANLGVVAGIVFLAIEIQQNSELMVAASRGAQNQRIQEYAEQVYMVPGLAEIIVKANNGGSLTEVEALKLFNRQLRIIRGFEVQYAEYMRGTVPLPRNWKKYFNEGMFHNPPLTHTWEEVRPFMEPNFVQHIDENVLDR